LLIPDYTVAYKFLWADKFRYSEVLDPNVLKGCPLADILGELAPF
jgi:hypothetical protein